MRVCGTENCTGKIVVKNKCQKCYDVWKYQANKEKIKQRTALYYSNNKERILPQLKEYRKQNKKKIAAYKKVYQQSEQGKAVIKKWLKSESGKVSRTETESKYSALNKHKDKARNLANYYLPEAVCEITDCNEMGEKHHPDYSKPLEVTYLCKKHHVQEEIKIMPSRLHDLDEVGHVLGTVSEGTYKHLTLELDK